MPAPWYPQNGHLASIYPKDAEAIKLFGEPIPGWPTITKCDARLRIDYKQVKGRSAARPTISGVDTSTEIEMEISVITREQQAEVNGWLRVLAPQPGKDNAPIPIEADAIEHLYIRDVVIKAVSMWSLRGKAHVVKITMIPWVGSEKRRSSAPPKKTPQKALPPDKRAQDAARRGNPVPSAQPAAASKAG